MKFYTKGFSLTEIIVVLAILSLITGISTYVFQNINRKQSLEKAVANITSVINSVRSLSISSKEFCSYGISISTTSNSISSFVVPDPSCTPDNFEPTSLLLNSFGVIMYNLTVNGGSITFQKITGDTTNIGSFSLRPKDNPDNSSTTITVYSTGLLEIN
jgi:prepilin-type N-terminal cleavage/methylation domain-containing protein